MVATTLLFAASSILSLAFAAPITRSAPRSLVERNSYTVYGGNGSPSVGWPAQSSWKSFDDLWSANKDTIKGSCTQFSAANPTDAEVTAIHDALVSVSGSSGLPKEFLLAVMMQESKGCPRAPTTNYGVNNPGLFQSFNGAASCNNGGVMTSPCPSDTITAMVKEGAGIGLQFGLTQAISQSNSNDVSKYYKGARIYNSGSLDGSGNLGAGIATHCYASDIANRLLGWASESTSCQEATVGSLQGTATNTQQTTTDSNTTPSSTPTNNNTNTNTTPATNNPTAPKAAGASTNCKSWYTVKAGDTCDSTGVALAKLRELNTSLDGNCSNLWAGSAYCTA